MAMNGGKVLAAVKSLRHVGIWVTLPGVVFLGVTFFVLIAAVNSQANSLFFALGLMGGVFVVSGVLAWLSVRGLEVKRVIHEHPIAGEIGDIQYVVTNHKTFFPCFAIRVSEARPSAVFTQVPQAYAVHLGAKQAVSLGAPFVASRRGVVYLNEIRVSCSFPFGFLRRVVYLKRVEKLVVYPRIGALNHRLALRCRDSVETGTMTSNRRGGHDEFYGLREYRPGDNFRNIHWKSSARTGLLMTREMAANAPPQMIVVLNVRGWQSLADGREQVERAIELAAALLCYGFLENFAVGLAIAGVEGGAEQRAPPSPKMGRESRSQLLYQLAILDAERVKEGAGFPMPNRLVGRAEWIVVGLRETDGWRDLMPPFAGSANHTVLTLDHAESGSWLHFLSTTDTHRLLRESSAK